MSNFAVTSSPHLRDKATSQRIMQEVCLALAPAGIAGIILYGLLPSCSLAGGNLEPVMQVKTVVTHVKEIKAGQCSGYGFSYKADFPTTVATVAIGYADGLPRHLKDKNYTMNINGVDYPLIAVCMDQCMLDVTFGNVKVGDEVYTSNQMEAKGWAMTSNFGHADTIRMKIVSDYNVTSFAKLYIVKSC